jgi:hypothetical protein
MFMLLQYYLRHVGVHVLFPIKRLSNSLNASFRTAWKVHCDDFPLAGETRRAVPSPPRGADLVLPWCTGSSAPDTTEGFQMQRQQRSASGHLSRNPSGAPICPQRSARCSTRVCEWSYPRKTPCLSAYYFHTSRSSIREVGHY